MLHTNVNVARHELIYHDSWLYNGSEQVKNQTTILNALHAL